MAGSAVGSESPARRHERVHAAPAARFQGTSDPQAAIATYLAGVLEEAQRRGYAFDASRIVAAVPADPIEATKGQLLYEWLHLKRKLEQRDPVRHDGCQSIKIPAPHPLFCIVANEVHAWERVR